MGDADGKWGNQKRFPIVSAEDTMNIRRKECVWHRQSLFPVVPPGRDEILTGHPAMNRGATFVRPLRGTPSKMSKLHKLLRKQFATGELRIRRGG